MLNNIAKQQFLELLALSKQMKKNIITIKNDRILGSDETCSTLSVIHYDYMDKFNEYASSGIMEVTFVLNEVVAFLKSYDLLSPNITVDMYGMYDINTGEAKDFYSDSNNRILGYNYEENIVYLYSFSKNEIEAKDLDDNSVTTLSSLEKAQTIKFTWCDKTLFWIYENDEVESYGGYLDL